METIGILTVCLALWGFGIGLGILLCNKEELHNAVAGTIIILVVLAAMLAGLTIPWTTKFWYYVASFAGVVSIGLSGVILGMSMFELNKSSWIVRVALVLVIIWGTIAVSDWVGEAEEGVTTRTLLESQIVTSSDGSVKEGVYVHIVAHPVGTIAKYRTLPTGATVECLTSVSSTIRCQTAKGLQTFNWLSTMADNYPEPQVFVGWPEDWVNPLEPPYGGQIVVLEIPGCQEPQLVFTDRLKISGVYRYELGRKRISALFWVPEGSVYVEYR